MNGIIATQGSRASSSPYVKSFTVDAFDNSFSRGNAAETISLVAGQRFSVSVEPDDLWSSGKIHGWSSADGLCGNLFSTGTDNSGEPEGKLIGEDYGPCQLGKFYAPYGCLVGKIGGGDLFKIGTHFSGISNANGPLRLYYWDENRVGNSGSITVYVELVPERAPTGFQGIGMLR
jgi:hypothetical protein